ncbi:hypothetical protein MO867_07605 [Microbulbifer sp. OS29]|uniref:Uncharacterized protein n=1 Tax=Microbulbifer okhotskensis TaxID=2926617 RepID=A0A9X2ER50_9GAMM|nr:hypothetical protein [Microbulbifer okhotskensis]MCO1334208.1 hypothetical protein [Microbulbifer okhotskensis]
MSVIIKCATKARIRILKGGWQVAEDDDESKYVKNLAVNLSIVGSKKNGYHLLMEPKGCFVADSHYESISEAKKDARDSLGVNSTDWV